jgi:cytochrome c peroxidase
MKKNVSNKVRVAGFVLLSFATGVASALSDIEQLGKKLYFDTNLSDPDGQACVSCHHPGAGFADPDANLPVSEGVIPGLFGGRNAPSAAYAMYAPPLFFEEVEGLWIGGQFWDGRATGNPALDALPGTLPDSLGDPLADQARGPFLNPVEMANTSKQQVIDEVAASSYAKKFLKVWGKGSLDDVESAYDKVALSIAAFERSKQFGAFSSKYDVYLQACLAAGGGKVECADGSTALAQGVAAEQFTPQELAGMNLFMGKAQCVLCHVVDWTPAPVGLNVQVPNWSPDGTVPPMFTDFTYDNLGVPVNPEIAALIGEPQPIDNGLGVTVSDAELNGLFKVMTLRNIGITQPYAHNGYFKTLKGITHFYNTAEIKPECPTQMTEADALANNCWPTPEVPETINRDELGDLGLTPEEEDAVAAFMMTLTDGYE